MRRNIVYIYPKENPFYRSLISQFGSQVHMDRFARGIGNDAQLSKFVANTRLLVSTEWDSHIGVVTAINPHS